MLTTRARIGCCHGGDDSQAVPDWLVGENYFCDSGLRGGPRCQVRASPLTNA